jgi:beta-lactamase regulating signal transducer with metallopeptidase domain
MHALGWALVHSLWQGALLALLLGTLLAIVPSRAARARYALAVTTLVLMLALPLRTALRVSDAAAPAADPAWTSTVVALTSSPPPGGADGATVERLGPAARDRTAASVAAVVARLRAGLEPTLPWVVGLWLCGVLVLSLRLTSGWLTAQQLESLGTRPAPPACAEALARLALRLGVTRPVRVLQSAIVQVPAVIGWLRPVVLLPASALTGLTPLQLDALLAHELAHVRRCDYLVNLVQSMIETLLFYHPAVWWVSRRVRQEREHCCDDLAVSVCGDAFAYARALVGMEGLRAPAPSFAMAAGGGSLLDRIRRLVAPVTPEIFPRRIAGVAAVTVALAIGGGSGLADATAARVGQAETGSPGRQARDARQASTDSLLARIRSIRDEDARREAVERLGRRGDPSAVAALIAIAREDRDEDVQRDAVESLGRTEDPNGLRAVVDIARSHPNPDVRREAVETVAEEAPAAVALDVLEGIARQDRDVDVQQEAVEALGKLRDPLAMERVRRLARTHPNPAVRRTAIDDYAEGTPPDSALGFLREVLAADRSPVALAEALEELVDLPGGVGIPALTDAARTHPSAAVRAEARRVLRDRD